MQDCEDITSVWEGFHNSVWKATYYRPDWSQLEVAGYTHFNTYQCLTVSECAEGAALFTSDCRSDGLTRMHPDTPNSDGAVLIQVDDCPGFCIQPAKAGAQLTACPWS